MICFPSGARCTPCRTGPGTPPARTECTLQPPRSVHSMLPPRLCTASFRCWNVLSLPLCSTSSTGLQVQLTFHLFQGNFPSYLPLSELDTREPVFLCRPSMAFRSCPRPGPHLSPLPPVRTHISIRAERMCTFLPRSGPQPPCPEPTCFVRLRESLES